MTDQPLPKFPSTPEEMKAASEKAMNFWVGALSPMWVPFWAASSFGLGAWAMSQSMSQDMAKKMGERLGTDGLMPGNLMPDSLMKMPMATKWPGFSGMWGPLGATAETDAPVETHAPVPMPEMMSGVTAAMMAAMTHPVTEAPVEAAPVAKAPEPLKVATPKPVQAKAAKPKTTKPVVAKTPVEAPVPVKVVPKPIAKSMSAVKKPKS